MIEFKHWRIVKGAYYFVINKLTGFIYLRDNLEDALEVIGCGRYQ